MFPANPSPCQSKLFGSQTLLSERKQQKLKESKQAVFYELIFRQIPEDEFAVLYSGRDSRPNAPVNTLVAALNLKHRHLWSYEELFDHIDFDLSATPTGVPSRACRTSARRCGRMWRLPRGD